MRTWNKARRKITQKDFKKGKKELFHAIRYLTFANQIAAKVAPPILNAHKFRVESKTIKKQIHFGKISNFKEKKIGISSTIDMEKHLEDYRVIFENILLGATSMQVGNKKFQSSNRHSINRK